MPNAPESFQNFTPPVELSIQHPGLSNLLRILERHRPKVTPDPPEYPGLSEQCFASTTKMIAWLDALAQSGAEEGTVQALIDQTYGRSNNSEHDKSPFTVSPFASQLPVVSACAVLAELGVIESGVTPNWVLVSRAQHNANQPFSHDARGVRSGGLNTNVPGVRVYLGFPNGPLAQYSVDRVRLDFAFDARVCLPEGASPRLNYAEGADFVPKSTSNMSTENTGDNQRPSMY